jgi:hypothetical protein
VGTGRFWALLDLDLHPLLLVRELLFLFGVKVDLLDWLYGKLGVLVAVHVHQAALVRRQ